MLRPTFLGFETAKRGLAVSQKSLDIVGNNLSNIDTAGYTRQRLDTTSVAPSAYSTRVATSRVGLTGQGVDALGVSQMRDAFLDKRFRDEYSQASYNTQVTSILTDLEAALGDADNVAEGGDVFMKSLEQLFITLNDFSSDPTSVPHANLVLSAFNTAAQTLQTLNHKVEQVGEQQKYDLNINVNNVNAILEQIAHLNETIRQDATVLQDPDNEYFRPNELLDQRNLLLDELASYGDISVKDMSDGTVTVTFGGKVAVSGGKFDGINLFEDSATGVVTLHWKSTGDQVGLTAGGLKGFTDFLNGRGANVQNPGETSKQGVLYYKDRLDTLARTLANVVNRIVPEMEEDPDAAPDDPDKMKVKLDENGSVIYKELLSAKQADGATNSNLPVTAANISISDKWLQNGADYFVYHPGSKENNYALQIITALNEADTQFVSYGETFTGTFSEYLIDYTGKIGSDTSFYEGRQQVTSEVADDLLDRRDEVSAVSENEETVNMMTFQKSFNAISRVMTTLDDLLETLINRTGRVGL